MFEELKNRLVCFISDRNWESHHFPKNLVMALTREIAELSEHFITPPTPETLPLIKDELGDVFNTLISLARLLSIDLLKAPPTHDISKNEIAHLVFLGGNILEHFLWKTDDESKNIPLSPSLERDVYALYSSLFHFAKKFHLDLTQCGIDKLDKAEKKYPISKVKGSLDGYYACKLTQAEKEELNLKKL